MNPFKLLGKVNRGIARVISHISSGAIGLILHYFVINGLLGLFIQVLGFSYEHFFPYTAERQAELKLLTEQKQWVELYTQLDVIPYFLISVGGYLFGFIFAIIGLVKAQPIFSERKQEKTSKKYSTFGNARYATQSEITKLGLKGNGIVFGKRSGSLVEKPPQIEGHALVVGGTGTGKSRGIAIPTLLRWQGAALVVDIKGELSNLTAGARPGKVFIFDPEGEGDPYDPLLEAKTIDGAQELARTLIPNPKSGDTFWTKTAQGLLAAAALEGAHTGKTLSEVTEKLCTTPPDELTAYLQRSEIKAVRLLSSVAVGMPEKTIGGVMAELRSHLLTLAADENVNRATHKSTWTAQSLEEGATVYLRVSEHMLAQYKELWSVIINQIMRHLSKRPEKANPPILLLLDELPRLGAIPSLIDALATLRSRNVHIVPIVQSMAQLDTIYGQNERKVIADNCRFKFVLSATDPETQKYFSDLAGQRTALAQGRTVGAGLVPNFSVNEQGTPLIRPETWARLEKPILFAPGLQPAQIDLAFWDQERELKTLVRNRALA